MINLWIFKEREKKFRTEAESYITKQDTEIQQLKTELKQVPISLLVLDIQLNSVITNTSGPAKSVRYNRVNLCS